MYSLQKKMRSVFGLFVLLLVACCCTGVVDDVYLDRKGMIWAKLF